MPAILLNVLLTMAGGALAAASIGWLFWTILSRTRFPGIGPVVAFAILALALHPSDFVQMLLLFSGIVAVGGIASLLDSGRDPPGRRKSVDTAAKTMSRA